MTLKKRTMKENALRNEVARINSIRRREKLERLKDRRAIQILGSSEIAKAILRKKGYTPESTG